jgi:glycine/D-amino acid oxidase-like deaminating enzyme
MSLDYIIVGNGLAGSLIANELLKAGKSVKVFDDPKKQSSSSVAGGMFNPVTGKYLAKTWLDDQLYPFLLKFYRNLEEETQLNFLHQTDIFRPFSNLENKVHFLKQIEKNELQAHITVIESNNSFEKHIKAPFGGLLTKSAGWVNVPLLLTGIDKILEKSNCIIDQSFDFEKLVIEENQVSYDNLKAKNIIFCEGYYVKDNPFFNWLPFNPVKGELLVGKIKDYDISQIINQGKWIIPLGNQKVRIGATYSWHELDFLPTSVGQENILIETKKFLTTDIEIESQAAGVRPSTKDRRPIIGAHPKHKNLFIFNGLGTKGVSVAPFFVNQFLDLLFFQKDIHPETTIDRFYSLYSL